MLNANCHSPHTLHTVGHSTRTLETLIGLLRLHSIEIVIDVRRWRLRAVCPISIAML